MVAMACETPLIQFYLGTTADHRGRMIDEIWAQPHFWLEHTHDYIQWLFPIPEAGRFNSFAPLLGEAEQKTFSRSEELKRRQRTSLDLMLDFFGLEWNEALIAAKENLDIRTHIWLKPGGHNHLRITRIIRSLHLCGQPTLASAFQNTVITIGTERGAVSSQTLQYWRSAIPSSSDSTC